jgi:hypothetical protein
VFDLRSIKRHYDIKYNTCVNSANRNFSKDYHILVLYLLNY